MARRLGVALVSLLACAALTSSASAATGDPLVAQCFSSAALAPCVQISPPLFEGMDVEVSPDGAQVYLLARPGVIRVFDRAADGNLTLRAGADGCYNSNGSSGCTAVPGLGEPFNTYDLELSPDGISLYVSAGASFAHLQRSTTTGSLAPTGCYGSGAGCTSVSPVVGFYAVEVSKDGQNVYTRGNGTLGAFQRNTSTGTLIPEPDGEDCFTETAVAGCTDSYGLAGVAFELDFSPDGKFLYYTDQTPGGIAFAQRIANGSLTQITGPSGGCITVDGSSGGTPAQCATIADGSGAAMSNSWAATASGGHVFSSGGSGTVVFSRNSESGKLTKVECIAPTAITACNERTGSAGMGVAVSPDGKRAIVGSSEIGGVGIYDFNDATGALTQLPSPLGCFSGLGAAGCGSFPGGADYGKIAWAPDGLNFYATAGGPLVNMALERAPATAGPQPPSSPPPPFDNKVLARWKVFETYTAVKRLIVRALTTDAKLRLTCKGRGCPFGSKAIPVKKAGDLDLTKRFNFSKRVKGKKRKIVSKLRPGAVVEVQIYAADRIGKAVRYTMRKGKQPSSKVLCMPPGGAKPQSSC